ncbi:uncharacterized protein PHACADRAFT_252446 [Phanerochaete carnosa HHB-10118-sp]|uniref:Uncharacterized protein n=1 Tax=Phanerochaete carnosa (strain HHB-10118-sp) TaxID=650164 RepID=K5V6C6_PHACS|nr:uncharacterized protein PHACADRAFT_252446 [Phanerochaete carnosa HHB-10118-sp]EKM58256.1 hypothetical protein PHACADRAFT_252446 [Phanerochaete carnosa HHB-10118-sp]
MHIGIAIARHDKRQTLGSGTSTVGEASPTDSQLIISTGVLPDATLAIPLVSGFTPTISSIATSTAASSSSASPAATSNSAALKGSSSVSLSTVIAACVGAFAGMALLVSIFIWWSRHPSTKSRNLPRSPVAENRNARGREEQERTRTTQQMTQQEADEKNFSMFKKRSPSTRTTRTAKVLEEHGFDMPSIPTEISKYRPGLAKELALEDALEEPERPYAARQDSGVSWDGETLGDDSFLSLRSVRIESGSMSPTIGMAKMTPPAMPSQLHYWESAEVVTIGDSPAAGSSSESANPFADANEDKRRSHSNPFFNAGELHRASSRRSRSNSRGQSQSRRASRSTVRVRVASEVGSAIDPFADITDPPPAISLPDSTLPNSPAHRHNMSLASDEAEQAMEASDRAMQSLIAALDLTKGSGDTRLRIQSTHSIVSLQPSPSSAYSFQSGEIGVARDSPPSPVSPQAH